MKTVLVFVTLICGAVTKRADSVEPTLLEMSVKFNYFFFFSMRVLVTTIPKITNARRRIAITHRTQ